MKQAGIVMDIAFARNDGYIGSELKRPQHPKPPYPYEVREVSIEHPAGHRLAGTLTVPAGQGPHPAAVLISGSGPQDRDETLLGHKPFLVIADYLTRHDIAVLRYDDRGTGQSTGEFSTATTQDFATDALAAVNSIMTQDGVDPERIGLIGHSEGAMGVRDDEELPGQLIEVQLNQLTSPWMRYFLTSDPRPALAGIKCPVLACNGTLDLQVWHEQNLEVIEQTITEAGGDVTAKRYEGLNHLFQPATTGSVAEYATIEITFDETVLRDIVQWIKRKVTDSKPRTNTRPPEAGPEESATKVRVRDEGPGRPRSRSDERTASTMRPCTRASPVASNSSPKATGSSRRTCRRLSRVHLILAVGSRIPTAAWRSRSAPVRERSWFNNRRFARRSTIWASSGRWRITGTRPTVCAAAGWRT